MISIDEIIQAFQIPGRIIATTEEYGSGHINNTCLLQMENQDSIQKYIVQKINTEVFLKPEHVMSNIIQVTKHLQKAIAKEGGDPRRETLHFLKNKKDTYYEIDQNGNYWRVYEYIDQTITLQRVKDPRDMYSSGRAFAMFNKRLADFPVDDLYETIPDFHNTPMRFQQFVKIIEQNPHAKLEICLPQVDFILAREKHLSCLTDQLTAKKLPLRVTHNDTKINNVLFDARTKQGICVIDLDTVMPGLIAYDFGDAVRFGASTALEDETDLTQVSFSIELFEAFTKGFLEILASVIDQVEIDSLIQGAYLMTLEVGMRFLQDYLQGDIYFKTDKNRPQHNLERAKNQLKLVSDMEQSWSEMKAVVNCYR